MPMTSVTYDVKTDEYVIRVKRDEPRDTPKMINFGTIGKYVPSTLKVDKTTGKPSTAKDAATVWVGGFVATWKNSR